MRKPLQNEVKKQNLGNTEGNKKDKLARENMRIEGYES